MEHYSFQGPFAYRWLDDVPVERIDLRSGERRSLRFGPRRRPPAGPDSGAGGPEELRSLMATWN